ncbi:MAG: ComF family protein [Chloroflexi bacterium]|nr:ComF family protein [Chloroflexota bacterium]
MQRSPLVDSPLIQRHFAVGPHAGVLRSAIHALKYEREKRAGELLGHLINEQLETANVSFDIIIPVPLHEARLRERGYNQAKMIALGVSRGTLLSNALERHRYTTSQVNLSAHERQSNVQDAFRARDTFTGERVLLVDDVCTTGATLLACASALQESGVGDIYAATVSYAVD